MDFPTVDELAAGDKNNEEIRKMINVDTLGYLSLEGTLESTSIEINGHVEGKITADVVIIGKSAVIKWDIFFKNTLKTEEGADIDGYIKRINSGQTNTEEDIAIEEIVERAEPKRPEIVPVAQSKEVG